VKQFINEDYRILASNIKKQNPDNSLVNNMKASAEASQDMMKGILIGTFAMNVVMTGAMTYMTGMIRSLQLILHLPIFSVVIPGNVAMMFSLMVPVVMYDILDSSYTSELLLTFDWDGQEEESSSIRSQVRDLGYGSHNSILNLGSVLVFVCFYFIEVIFYWCIKIYWLITRKLNDFRRKLVYKLFFKEIFGLMLEAYLEFIIAGWLNVQDPLDTTNGEVAAYYVAIAGLVFVLIVMPGAFAYALTFPPKQFMSRKFTKKFGAFYEDIAIKIDQKGKLYFYMLFMARRIIYVTLAFSNDIQIYHIIFLQYLNIAMIIYQESFRPLETRIKNRIETFNEVIISLASMHLFFFTDWLPDPDY